MTYEELLATSEYWTTKIQIELYQKVEQYLKDNKMTRTELAQRLGVSKGYISQIMNGDYNHRISKLVELALAIGYIPHIVFEEQNKIRTEVKYDVHKDLNQYGYVASK
jgi:transcriptional regulator with XRE-family HTH domain